MHGPRPSRWQVSRPEWLSSTHDNLIFSQQHRFTRSITVRRRIGDASHFPLDNLAGTAGEISPAYEYLLPTYLPIRVTTAPCPVPAVCVCVSEPRICSTKTDRPTSSSLQPLGPASLGSYNHHHQPIFNYPKSVVGAQLPPLFAAIHSQVVEESHPSASLRRTFLAGGVERDTVFLFSSIDCSAADRHLAAPLNSLSPTPLEHGGCALIASLPRRSTQPAPRWAHSNSPIPHDQYRCLRAGSAAVCCVAA